MIMNDVAESGLVLGEGPTTLLEMVAKDPTGPLSVGLAGPGGHGKTALLAELARVHQQAGGTVRTGAPPPDEEVAPDTLVLVDDAHLLDDARLAALLRLAATRRHRLVIAHRPWPRSAALMELADTLRRDGQALLLTAFTREQTAAYLADTVGQALRDDLVDFVHTQTGGVPRDVERLARGLRGPESGAAVPVEPPRSTVLEFVPDLEVLAADVRRLLLAVAAGVPLPVSMLGALLGREPEAVDELIATTRAAGLLGADGRLAPIVRRAVTTLSPATDRSGVWRRLTELQLARGGAVRRWCGHCSRRACSATARPRRWRPPRRRRWPTIRPSPPSCSLPPRRPAGRPAPGRRSPPRSPAISTAPCGWRTACWPRPLRPTARRPPWWRRRHWRTAVTPVAAWSCTGGRAPPRRWRSPPSAGSPPATRPPPGRRRATWPASRPRCTPAPPD
uniref:hypothetical protein n=1 Tax=Micromonospora acroterricola TaxID=2202421 RepID=UPI001F179F87|nr:hypothetical protein [Micromonospora acroterricola]